VEHVEAVGEVDALVGLMGEGAGEGEDDGGGAGALLSMS